VSKLIAERMGGTLTLVAISGLLSVLISLPLGVISAVKKNTAADKILSVFALFFVSSPVFLTAIVFMFIFAYQLRWFPTIGTGTWRHMVLPSVALALNMVALTSRITRATMIAELDADYIRTARAKGIPNRRVILRYALHNALIPIITVTSVQIGAMLVGAVLVETVFAMGGLGDLLLTAVKTADYPVVQGVTLLLVCIFLCLNLLVDLLYAALDPRIRVKT
jgi:peptide/nickel transport system permease protein